MRSDKLFGLYPNIRDLQSFADVPISDEGVQTQAFLEASDGLVQMFGELPVFYAEDLEGRCWC
jgi:hypothetical protein